MRILTVAFIVYLLCLCGCNDQPAPEQPKPLQASTSQPTLVSASPEEIQRRGGPASSVRRKQTTYATQSAELWYPAKKVEIITSRQEMGNPLWTPYGGYRSRDSKDERDYTNRQLAKLMPCLSEWTDAVNQAEKGFR